MIVYRPMVPEDIPAGLSLCRFAGWNQVSRDWELFLKINSKGCYAALDEADNVIGTVTTLPYEKHFLWIGMVLVHPSKKRQGIGTQLLKTALQLTSEYETVKLDATPEGRAVYEKLKFADEYRIERMLCPANARTAAELSTARAMREEDFPGILKLDSEVFGADRRPVLEWSYKGAPRYAFVIDTSGEIKGFSLGRAGYNFDHIGPIVAQTTDMAVRLLVAALQQAGDKPVVIDAPNHTPEWSNSVLSMGFVLSRPFIRMYRGPNLYPGIPEKQFAIVGPELG